MNAGLQKLVDSGFMNAAQAEIIEGALARKEHIIVSGHKGWGILPLLATVGACAKESYKVNQVKDESSLADVADYFLLVSPKTDNFEKLITDALLVPDARVIAIKDPDHPYSVMKVLKDVYKAQNAASAVYQVIECAKVDDVKVLSKITQMQVDAAGKVSKKDW